MKLRHVLNVMFVSIFMLFTANAYAAPVTEKAPIADSVITTKVKAMFIKEKLFDKKDVAAMSIDVTTTNGVVNLTGTVHNKKQVANAIKIAKSVKGVKNVESHVEVVPVKK